MSVEAARGSAHRPLIRARRKGVQESDVGAACRWVWDGWKKFSSTHLSLDESRAKEVSDARHCVNEWMVSDRAPVVVVSSSAVLGVSRKEIGQREGSSSRHYGECCVWLCSSEEASKGSMALSKLIFADRVGDPGGILLTINAVCLAFSLVPNGSY